MDRNGLVEALRAVERYSTKCRENEKAVGKREARSACMC